MIFVTNSYRSHSEKRNNRKMLTLMLTRFFCVTW